MIYESIFVIKSLKNDWKSLFYETLKKLDNVRFKIYLLDMKTCGVWINGHIGVTQLHIYSPYCY